MENKYDYLVIGSGISGMYFALRAAEKGTVLLLSKDKIEVSNTFYAQGGIASVSNISIHNSEDTFQSHIEDTLTAGAGICDYDAVKQIVENGPEVIDDIIKYGVEFTKSNNVDEYSLHREGGHKVNRIFHFQDITGQEVVRGLSKKVLKHKNITFMDNMISIDLITEHQKVGMENHKGLLTCYGAYVFDERENKVIKIMAKSTVLATGGTGRVYMHTTNPSVATGDGIAMAYRAKAVIANLEFVQFHPTTLYTGKEADISFLITEAIRGFGAILKDKNGREFMNDYHELKSLAPRDIVARAIDNELKKSGDKCVYLDMTFFPAKKVMKSFPNIYKECLKYGIDITKEYIPVVPAAHYQCGGILTDLNAKTNILGLYSIGESACTGVHGANRLASNSLLEALVYAKKALISADKYIQNTNIDLSNIKDWNEKATAVPREKIFGTYLSGSIKRLMSSFVGIVRSDERLDFAKKSIDLITRQIRNYYKKTIISRDLIELRNISDIASLIIRSAIERKESRGLHYNIDKPNKSDGTAKKFTKIKSRA